jgi:hypothetical protein
VVGEFRGKRQLERPSHGGKKMLKMGFREVGWKDVTLNCTSLSFSCGFFDVYKEIQVP